MRRARSLRTVLAVVMVAVAAVAMFVVGAIDHQVTSSRLRATAEDQLEALLHARSRAIVDGLERIRAEVSILAADPTVAAAVREFGAAIAELEDAGPELVDDAQRAAVRSVYAGGLADPARTEALIAAGLSVPEVDDLVPADPVATYLQYHYLASAPEDAAARVAVDDAGDGSTWSQVHARRHPFLRDVARSSGFRDVLLVPLGGRIAYTVGKSADLGVDLGSTGFDTSALAQLGSELIQAPVGEAALIDFEPYLGGLDGPALLVAAIVRDGSESVGVIVVQIPPDQLTSLMTGGGRWAEVGLGETGETFVVGRDLRLRSDARGWIEDPQAHLDRLRSNGDEEVADAVAAIGSTVLVQPVATEAVETALGGARFVGSSSDAFGETVLAVAAPLPVVGLDWVVVAEISRDEALAELDGYVRDVLVLAAVLVPLVALAGVVLAARATRPVGPLVAAAEEVAAGRLHVDLDDPSRDEFGHLARELQRRAAGLAAEDAALEQQRRSIDELLLAVLPDRLLDAVRTGRLDIGDLADTATVITLTIDGLGAGGAGGTGGAGRPGRADGAAAGHPPSRAGGLGSEDDDQLSPSVAAAAGDDPAAQVAAALESLAREHRVERAWSSADRHLFLAGLGRVEEHGCDDAVAFVADAMSAIAAIAAEAELTVSVHGALAAGDVATGIVGGGRVSLGVWGRTARVALALDAAAERGSVLVHDSVLDRLSGSIGSVSTSVSSDRGRSAAAALPDGPMRSVSDATEELGALVWRPLDQPTSSR